MGALTGHTRAGRWLVGLWGVLVLGAVARLVIGGTGERSAAVLALLLGCCVCAALWLIASPRAALAGAVVAVALLNLAMIGPRSEQPYDDRAALYRTDQVVALQASGSGSVLPVWVEPRYSRTAPSFRLLVNDVAVTCSWQPGIQRIGVPVSGPGEVRLQVAGSPARDGDYLIVYSSARQPSVPLQADTTGLNKCTSAG